VVAAEPGKKALMRGGTSIGCAISALRGRGATPEKKGRVRGARKKKAFSCQAEGVKSVSVRYVRQSY